MKIQQNRENNMDDSDFPANQDEKVEEKSDKEEEKSTNMLFGFMIILTVIGSSLIVTHTEEFTKPIREANEEYEFPAAGDFQIVLVLCPILIVIKIALERLSQPFCELILAKKYKNPEDESSFALGKIYIKKLSTNVYKLCFYIFNTSFGYSILSQLSYFPSELLGKGTMMKMWEAGYPDSFFHWKPAYFDLYYLLGLSFCMTDLIWLLFIYELQSDFILMLLHHLCTISLISFSYLSNYSNVGCIVLFLHDVGDIFVYIARLVVNTDCKKRYVIASALLLLVVYIYTRIYVFANLIYTIFYGITWEWQWVTTCLLSFLCFLYVMHVNWVYLIMKKFSNAVFKNKYEDTSRIKKFENKNK